MEQQRYQYDYQQQQQYQEQQQPQFYHYQQQEELQQYQQQPYQQSYTYDQQQQYQQQPQQQQQQQQQQSYQQQQYQQSYSYDQQQSNPNYQQQQQHYFEDDGAGCGDIPDEIPTGPVVDKESGQVFIQETEQLLTSSIAQFRSIVGENVPITFCLQHLRHKKFKVDQAVEVYRANLAFRAEKGFPRQFRFVAVERYFRTGFITVCGKDKFGRQILYGRPRFNIPEEWEKMLQMMWCLMEGFLREEQFQRCGMIMIMDPRDAGLHNFSRDLVQNFARTFQTAMPMRLGGMFICYPPSFFRIVWSIVSLFLKAKMRKRVRVLGENIAALKEIATPENLPVELGGTGQFTSPESVNRFCEQRRALDDVPIE